MAPGGAGELRNNESFEPYTQNLYVRRVLSGEFVQVTWPSMMPEVSGDGKPGAAMVGNSSVPTMLSCAR